MFNNNRTGQKQSILRGYKTEDEADAKARLEAAGWDFASAEYKWDDVVKTFTAVTSESTEGSDDE
jgi:hypothetical protein